MTNDFLKLHVLSLGWDNTPAFPCNTQRWCEIIQIEYNGTEKDGVPIPSITCVYTH